MNTKLDVGRSQKDSEHLPSKTPTRGRIGAKHKTTLAQRHREMEAKEFINEILIYPVRWEFNLWNLQGGWPIRMSCRRRKCVPADLDFAVEIELAKKLGWIEEHPEDKKFTKREQVLYHHRPIRYGATFVRLASQAAIKIQRAQFVAEFVKAGVQL